MSFLEQNITRKKRMNELFLEPEPKFDIANNKKYKVEAIKDSVIYAKKSRTAFIKPILFGFLEKLFRGKKHLGTIFYSHAPLKNDLHVSQRSFEKVNGNFFFPQFRFAYNQAVSQVRQAFC